MSLGQNIYRLRTEHKLSQEDFAAAMEVSRQSVSKWENDIAVPELEKLIKMAKLFEVSLDELVGNIPPQPKPEPAPAPTVQHLVFPTRMIVGILLLSTGILALFGLSVLLWLSGNTVWLSIFVAFPLMLCGIICLLCRHNPGYFCALSLYFLLFLFSLISVYFTGDPLRLTIHIFCILIGLSLLVWTVFRIHVDTPGLSRQGKLWIIVALGISLALCIVILLPPVRSAI